MTLRSLLPALLATASSIRVFGQAPAPAAAPVPAPAAAAATAAAPLTTVPFQNAGFEQPTVDKRTPPTTGGNPASGEGTDWGHFIQRDGKGEGALNIGMTNEIARSGKQSLYVDFAGITGKRFTATLMTQLVPVKPGVPYRVGMWGRMDKDRPLTLDQRRPYLRMEFEFYKADEETQVGDTEFRVMRLPGSLKKLLLTSSKWTQAYGIARAPADAALMKVSYVFNVPNEAGKTDGILFFDDASVEELPLDFPIEASDAIVVDTDEVDEKEATEDEDAKKDPLKSAVPIK